MSSRAGSEAARLRRLRRLAARSELAILAAAKPNPKLPKGGYMLSNDTDRRVILGDKPQPYSAGLDEIEAYLDADADEPASDT